MRLFDLVAEACRRAVDLEPERAEEMTFAEALEVLERHGEEHGIPDHVVREMLGEHRPRGQH